MAADDQLHDEIPHRNSTTPDPYEMRWLVEKGYLSPDFVLVQATGANMGLKPGWWGMDEVVKLAARTPDYEPTHYFNEDWWIVPTSRMAYVEGLFLDLSTPDRIRVRKLPEAP
jgi:hypothetical protein